MALKRSIDLLAILGKNLNRMLELLSVLYTFENSTK